ncbi:MAG: hypothetical protein WBA23_12910 [Tunicatimonas sp.]|uniref:hypothetical protein n=1 Tax=Tunicatimonas sp. TaxID=1940096 RepID=UPI003C713CCA
MDDKQLIPLDVPFAHIVALRSLPLLHHDPFDRLLIAQSIADDLQLATHDKIIQAYPDVDIVKV